MSSQSMYLVTPNDAGWSEYKAALCMPPSFRILGDSDNFSTAVAEIIEREPDLVVVAAQAHGISSVPFVEQVQARAPSAHIVVAAEEPKHEEYLAYLALGASAYLRRDAIGTETLRQCLSLRAGSDTVLVSRLAAKPAAPAPEPPLRVLLAERGDITRGGLSSLLSADPRFAVSEARTGFLAAARRLQPDLIVLDPRIDDSFDADLITALHGASPASRLVLFTAAFVPQAFLEVMQLRVHAYIFQSPGGSGAAIIEALLLVGHYGWVVVDGVIAEQFWTNFPQMISLRLPRLTIARLTPREREVLALSISGKTDQEIAAKLVIARSTVEYHMEHAREKLGATTRTQLGWLARDQQPQ